MRRFSLRLTKCLFRGKSQNEQGTFLGNKSKGKGCGIKRRGKLGINYAEGTSIGIELEVHGNTEAKFDWKQA